MFVILGSLSLALTGCLSASFANNFLPMARLSLFILKFNISFTRNWFTNNSTTYSTNSTNSTQLNPNIYVFMPNTAVPIYPTWQYNIFSKPATSLGEKLEQNPLFRTVTGNQTATQGSNDSVSTTLRSWTTSQSQILDDLMPVSLRPWPRGVNGSEEASGHVEPNHSASVFKIPSLRPFMFVPNYHTSSKSKLPLANMLNSSAASDLNSSTASTTSRSTSSLRREPLGIGGNKIDCRTFYVKWC